MKLSTLAVAALPLVAAAPAPWLRAIMAQLTGRYDDAVLGLQDTAQTVINNNPELVKAVHGAHEWVDSVGRLVVEQGGLIYEKIVHPATELTNYALRVTEPKLCDPDVKQLSGYLDIEESKHLFFWFFEARNGPKNAPLVLWLNGGPGCSSSTGLLFELGPCSITAGANTTHNKYSWTRHANVIFLDQPINVGYSFSDDGSTINNSPAAAVDVWAFLELFLTRFPQYANAPFHIAAESYGGHYAPNIASVVHKMNQGAVAALAPTPTPLKHINLASVVLANGITDPYVQYAHIPTYACEGPFPVLPPNGQECSSLRSKVPTCQRLVKACYDSGSRFACVPAAVYCTSQLYGPFLQLGLNPYDVRQKCDRQKDGDLCYKQMQWIDEYLNKPDVKRELGVPSELNFQGCNMNVNQGFLFQGDGARNSAALLPELLDAGIRVLVYAGNADFMCNFIGNEAWMLELPSALQEAFVAADKVNWTLLDSDAHAGRVRSVGPGAGNFTFVEVFDAGHMVPFDQPEAALDLIERWLFNVPLAF